LHEQQQVRRVKRKADVSQEDHNTQRKGRKRIRQKPQPSFWSSLGGIQTHKDVMDIKETRRNTDWRRHDDDTKDGDGERQEQTSIGRVKDINGVTGLERMVIENSDALQEIVGHYHEMKQDVIEDLREVKNENEKYKENNWKLIKLLNDLKQQTKVNKINILHLLKYDLLLCPCFLILSLSNFLIIWSKLIS
jgi:hypothetical protein